MRTLTVEELAAEAGADAPFVRAAVETGAIREVAPGRHEQGDIPRIRTIRALVDAGIDLDAIRWAVDNWQTGFDTLGHVYADPAPKSERSYAEFRASLGTPGRLVPSVYAAFGLPEPSPETRLRRDEEEIVAAYVALWEGAPPDVPLRAARLAGEGLRRMVEGWIGLIAEAGLAPFGTERQPDAGLADPATQPTARIAALVPRLLLWLQQSHLEHALTEQIVESFESGLERSGRLPVRERQPTAIGFVDLAGYTRLTEEAGDEHAARFATRLHELAEAICRQHDGRVVKLLGDGVMLRFPNATAGVSGTLELVELVAASGLPAAHAGIEAGRVVERDGDLFGRTVNLAARIAGRAGPGEVLVGPEVVDGWAGAAIDFVPIGPVDLKNVAQPVPLWRAARLNPARRPA